MLLVEINCNPYQLKTEIKFRGKNPRPFSRVNKFLKKPLQEWIKQLPLMLYDEMNGYDFLLQFTGTRLDFEELKKTFENADISSDKVKLQFKKELPAREGIQERFIKLRNYLKENPHPQFDSNVFYGEIDSFLSKKYPVLLIGEDICQNLASSEKIEYRLFNQITKVKESFLDIPILFYLNKSVMENLLSSLLFLQSRKDIKNGQIFFMIDESLDRRRTIREIEDYGFDNPIVIDRMDDWPILNFIRCYAVTKDFHQIQKVLTEKFSHFFSVFAKKIEVLQEKVSLRKRRLALVSNDLEKMKIRSKQLEDYDVRTVYDFSDQCHQLEQMIASEKTFWETGIRRSGLSSTWGSKKNDSEEVQEGIKGTVESIKDAVDSITNSFTSYIKSSEDKVKEIQERAKCIDIAIDGHISEFKTMIDLFVDSLKKQIKNDIWNLFFRDISSVKIFIEEPVFYGPDTSVLKVFSLTEGLSSLLLTESYYKNKWAKEEDKFFEQVKLIVNEYKNALSDYSQRYIKNCHKALINAEELAKITKNGFVAVDENEKQLANDVAWFDKFRQKTDTLLLSVGK